MGKKYPRREAKKMIRIHVICEGHTEEMFVNELLVPHMISRGISIIPAKIGKPGHKGGNVNYQRLLTDLKNRLLGDKSCHCTTLIDYYALPNEFPGKRDSEKQRNSKDKLKLVIEALYKKINLDIGEASTRFIPYIQLHEFEGLLFSSPESLAASLKQPSLLAEFHKIRSSFTNPEEINDSPVTAPSKRIQSLYSGYDKPVHLLLAANNIGLRVIRQECSLFDCWIKKLEALAPKNH